MNLRPEHLSALNRERTVELLRHTFAETALSVSTDPARPDVLVQDVRGNSTRFVLDDRGFLAAVTTPLGRTYRIDTDAEGRTTRLTNVAGHRLGLEYSDQHDVTRVMRDGRELCRFERDSIGRIASVAYYDGTTTSRRDEGGRVIVTDRCGAAETYEFRPASRLAAVTDGNRQTTRFVYGRWDRPDLVLWPDGSSESYLYDSRGWLSRLSVNADPVVDVTCGETGLPTELRYADGGHSRFAYDGAGRVLIAWNDHVTCTYEYDAEGRVVLENQGGHVIRYRYDEGGHLVGLTYPTGHEVTFAYDTDLRLTRINDWAGQPYVFEYGPNDGRVETAYPNGTVARAVLTPTGRPAEISVSLARASTPILAVRMSYDEEERVASMLHATSDGRAYEYDAESRLQVVRRADRTVVERFAYDPAGNRVGVNGETAVFNALNQLTRQGGVACAYDVAGNMTSMTEANRSSTSLSYDKRNLLTRVGTADREVARYTYDAFGRRIGKKVGDVEVRYVWAGEHLVREITQGPAGTESRDYLYIPGGHTPVAVRIGSEVYCYHTDHLGTPRRITDRRGVVVWSADFDAFGQARIDTAIIANALRFPGQYFDEETGLHYNRARYYSPRLGRYISRDPLTYVSGLNFYSYAGNDPVGRADPLGLWDWKTVVSVVAAVAVGAAVVALAPVALPLAIIAAGAAAGAVAFGLNAALNQKELSLNSVTEVAKETVRGAVIGAVGALPFAFLPAAAGVGVFMLAGGVSGAITYCADVATSDRPFSAEEFAWSVGIGAATAGLGRFLFPRLAAWRRAAKVVPGKVIVKEGKWDYFFGRVKSNPHNEARSLQNAKDLKTLGIEESNGGRERLTDLFEQGLASPETSRHVTEHGITITRTVPAPPNGAIDVKYFYPGGDMSATPEISTIIPKIF
jgi:RHS repeat-associated protein